MTEQTGHLAGGVILVFGSVLRLDPRFFQWNLFGNKRIPSPAERHRASFPNIGLTISEASTRGKGDEEYFRVSIYIQLGEVEGSWTGQSSVLV